MPRTETTASATVSTPPTATAPARVEADDIAIQSPAAGAKVDHRPIVRGTVGDPKAKVWVIIRPMRTSEYWVQPPVDVETDGTWSTQVYIGQGPSTNAGEAFKIMAVADPKSPLQEGERLRDWPPSRWRSRIVEVTKR